MKMLNYHIDGQLCYFTYGNSSVYPDVANAIFCLMPDCATNRVEPELRRLGFDKEINDKTDLEFVLQNAGISICEIQSGTHERVFGATKMNIDLLEDCQMLPQKDGLSLRHIPTGIFILVPNQRSQRRSMYLALNILQYAIKELNR